jgi:hypothetical protein
MLEAFFDPIVPLKRPKIKGKIPKYCLPRKLIEVENSPRQKTWD